jgi:hypothetical protein
MSKNNYFLKYVINASGNHGTARGFGKNDTG